MSPSTCIQADLFNPAGVCLAEMCLIREGGGLTNSVLQVHAYNMYYHHDTIMFCSVLERIVHIVCTKAAGQRRPTYTHFGHLFGKVL